MLSVKLAAAFLLISLLVPYSWANDVACSSAAKIDLAGNWRFQLDPNKAGRTEKWFASKLSKTIRLPGTTDMHGFGHKTTAAGDGRLSRVYEYIGSAWYQRDFNVPESWREKRITLSLELCKWKTTVWVNGLRIGSEDSLSTPHVYKLPALEPGPNTITIEIDNSLIFNIGNWSHSYTEETQSIWNGAVGRIELAATDPVWIAAVRVFPSKAADNTRLEVTIGNQTGGPVTGSITGQILDSQGQIVAKGSFPLNVKGKTATVDVNLPIPKDKKITRWDEFKPTIYTATVSLDIEAGGNKLADRRVETFGFRQIDHNGSHVTINGRPTFLRGTTDCATYPLTGHPPMDVASWTRVFRAIKAHGMNHVRYHSWCPPEAAFVAADRLGMILQVETSTWLDGWMAARRPPYPKIFGKDPAVVDFIKRELKRLLAAYGNHPSFCMLAIGNELDPRGDYDTLTSMIAAAKKHDPRHLYSVSAARKLTSADDFLVTHQTPGGKPTRGLRGPQNDWDFSKAVRDMQNAKLAVGPATAATANEQSRKGIPVIAHEIGQWPVYPCYDEIEKYTGPLRPRTIEGFRDKAASRGLDHHSRAFQQASGRFTCLLYKAEIEALLRTPGYGGFQLLQLNDFPGQREALVGILDSFWESKGIVRPAAFREFCCETVPLLRFDKFVWTNNETFTAKAQIAHFGGKPLDAARCRWSITDKDGKTVAKGVFPTSDIPTGKLTDIGRIVVPLSSVADARQLEVLLEIDGTQFRNRWNTWVFPGANESPSTDGGVLITSQLDKTAQNALAAGKAVLLIPTQIATPWSAPGRFMPTFWSAGWFPAGGNQTLGILCDPKHPALAAFPTDNHSDWQWHDLITHAKVFALNDVPSDQYTPIIRSISDFHQNNHLIPLFETKVGRGRLLACGFNLNGNLEHRPAARQLLKSLRTYAASGKFQPNAAMPLELLKKMFYVPPPAKTLKAAGKNGATGQSNPSKPHAIKNIESAVLDVQAAVNVPSKNRPHQWKAGFDRVNVKKPGFDYRPQAKLWKDESGSAWVGKTLGLQIKCPLGFHGKCYMHFHDWNRQQRRLVGEFESQRFSLTGHEGGVWTVFDIIREDALDGKLNLSTKLTSGPNVMITRIVLVPAEK